MPEDPAATNTNQPVQPAQQPAGQPAANQPIQLDNNFLASLGLGSMSDDDKRAFLQHLYEELELRVGTELSKNLTDQQLEEFELLINANDQQGAMRWLEANCPNYKEVVKAEIEKLRQEIIQNRDAILGQAAQAQTPPPIPPQQGGDQNGPYSLAA